MTVTNELQQWVRQQVAAGHPPEAVLAPMLENGWDEQAAVEAVEAIMRDCLEQHARENQLPLPTRVPVPLGRNGSSTLFAHDRMVEVLSSLQHPNIIVFGGVLSHAECDALVEMSRSKLIRSATVDLQTGGNLVHADRTSEGTSFTRGANALCETIEQRLAALLDWPYQNGEGLQVLRYGPGAQYKPHYDYFDPAWPGSAPILERGGQRVASLVIYLNTPEAGGSTVFPDVGYEVAAVKGNAVFFSYDRPHPITRSLHGGSPVSAGEKWIATKWLRERQHD